jgi:hypothetical protein
MIARLMIAGLLLLCACAEAPTTSSRPTDVLPSQDGQPQIVDATVADAAEGAARDGFYFLAPLVAEATYAGEFDGALLPYLTVEICKLGATGCTGPLIATFSADPRRGAELLRLDAALEQYIANWDTRSNLDPVPNYRVTVLAVGRPVGHLDVDVVANANQAKAVDQSQFVPLVTGRTLPIRFRVEKGGFLAVGPAGGSASLEGGRVELEVPAGALAAPVAMFVDPVGDEAEESIGLIPGSVFDITPSGTAFSKSVRLSIRYDEAALGGLPESGLTVVKKLGAVWVEANDAVIDADANVVSADVDGFSRWALGCKVVELVLQPGDADLNLRHEEVRQFSATPGCATTGASTMPVESRLIQWSSSAPSIAVVDAASGLVAAVSLGQAGVTAAMPRACDGSWPTVPPSATSCPPLESSAAPISVYRIVVQLAGVDGQPWPASLRWLGATRRLVATVSREPDGLPVSQVVEWLSSSGAATVSPSAGNLTVVTGASVGFAEITARAAVDPVATAFAPAIVTAGPRLTAVDLVGDINSLSKSYAIQEWDGMDYPNAFQARGTGGHLQGVARVGSTWVLSHSRDANRGLLIHGTNNNWTFTAPTSPDLGFHPGGIQASGDVVVVPHYTDDVDDSEKMSFFRVSAGGLQELASLRLTGPGGSAAGIGYHPVEDRWYVVNGREDSFGQAANQLYRTRRGLALTDPANCFVPTDAEDCSAAADRKNTPYLTFTAFSSQGAMQVIWDEKTAKMALIALYRPIAVDPLFTECDTLIELLPLCQNIHAITGSWIDVSNAAFTQGVEFLTRSDFDWTDNILFTPTFRFASGLLLDADGRVTIIGTERCTSYEAVWTTGPLGIPVPPLQVNAVPCEPAQDVVEYFILQPVGVLRAPDAPADLVATPVSPTQANLSWTDKSTNEVGFGVLRRKWETSVWSDWTPIAATAANATTYAATGLTAGATYQFRVAACNLVGCSKSIGTGNITMPTP